ncbi:L-lactate permease [Pontibacter qinzhouensis]|uniref:L-lactate permease n=1 Tax=Pontibacter qinzhouensis TaxID=2603253 RepID=A0A5C8K5D5_9BACT|nr:L-lactate permease [Pontibacter qinzhouensis]TXK44843.1 L-lactate permease [Pontibacter qinzhouensis]
MIYFLSFLPVAILIVVSLLKGVREAVLVGLVVTSALFFYWGATLPHFAGVISISLLMSLNILMIVFGALFLYNIMNGTGMIRQISQSLDELHPAKEVRFFLLAICLTAFFEGVAGFGTPGAIVPLILIALGFNALLAVAVVLLFDSMFSMFGAVGTPILTGLQLPLQLEWPQVQQIGLVAAITAVVAMSTVFYFIFRMFARLHAPLEYKGKVLAMFSFFALPFCVFSYWVPDLATVLAALVMLVLSVLYLRQGQTKIDFKPWLAYALLAVLLLLPKVLTPLRHLLGWELAFTDLFGTNLKAGIKLLQSPLIPFVLVGVGVGMLRKTESWYLAEGLKKLLQVLVVLFPSIAVAQLMIHSGVVQPSMVNNMAQTLSAMGGAYVIFSPFLGIIGVFITGSTTISNVVFGASQLETAQALQMQPTVILAMQLFGASMGNGICLFNIIAAASVANLKNYKDILSINMMPTVVAGLVAGGVGWLLLYLAV